MQSIVEQAKQIPQNATPIGWDDTELVYPGVNTCLSITAVGKGPLLVGMHLGLIMSPYTPKPGKEPEAEQVDTARLGMYLDVLKLQASLRGGRTRKIFVAGALAVWKSSAMHGQVPYLVKALEHWRRTSDATLEFIQFDDEDSMTVDIHAKKDGITFVSTEDKAPVGVHKIYNPSWFTKL